MRSCKHAQELALRVRERGDFVEHDSAGAAKFETAELAIHRSGEGAAFVAEKFALHQLRRKTSAINFQEGSVASRAEFMNEAREIIFAGAALSGN